jgi:SAM-dependent methyltransferase
LGITMADGGYVFAAEDPEQRSAALSGLFDPVTFRHVEALGIDRGWRCWEVGAGGSSVANWLAGRVGASGRVLATDIDTSWISNDLDAAVEVQRHDVALDDVPPGGFDLVHARFVLMHVSARAEGIKRMIAALRPGGWVLIEDFDEVLPLVCIDTDRPEHRRANKVHAGVRSLLAEHGASLEFARALPGTFRDAGLRGVGADAYFAVDLPAANLLGIANVTQMRDSLIAERLATAAEIDAHLHAMADGTVNIGTLPLVSAWGQRA